MSVTPLEVTNTSETVPNTGQNEITTFSYCFSPCLSTYRSQLDSQLTRLERSEEELPRCLKRCVYVSEESKLSDAENNTQFQGCTDKCFELAIERAGECEGRLNKEP